MKHKQQRKNVVIATIIIFGILVVVNILSYQFFHRFDLTEEREFSISDSTKSVLKELDDIVTIRAYFSQELPAGMMVLRQEVKDIFDEYKNYSGGKLKVEFIDPEDDAKKQEALTAGIPQIQFNIRERDKFEMRNGFMGVAIMYEDKKEVIPVVQSAQNLEYDLTSSIKKVTSSEVAKIGFSTGHGEWDRYNDMRFVNQDLEKQYTIEEIDFAGGQAKLDGIKTLVIAGPKQKFSERDLYEIDQYLMGGGNLFIALDSIELGEGLTSIDNETDLELLLSKYGLEFKNHLVLDVVNETVNFSQGFVTFFMNYPFWPKVVGEGLNQENVITSKLEALVFPWATTIEASFSENESEVIELAKTTARSWVAEAPYTLNPQQDFAPSGEQGSRVLAVMKSGKFDSYFVNKQIPASEIGESKIDELDKKIDSTETGRIVLVGDGDFMTDGFLQRFPDNGIFFENVIDYLSLGEELIGIRSRGVSDRSLEEIAENKKDSIKYGNIFGVTAVVILFGVGRFYSRRKRRFVDDL